MSSPALPLQNPSYYKMEIRLTSDEVKELGFQNLYVWDAFKSQNADLYDSILDSVVQEQIQLTQARRKLLRVIRKKIEDAGINVANYVMVVKAKRADERVRIAEES